MYQGEKIGVGIVTYNRKDGLLKLLNSLPRQCIDELVIINDGQHFPGRELSPAPARRGRASQDARRIRPC